MFVTHCCCYFSCFTPYCILKLFYSAIRLSSRKFVNKLSVISTKTYSTPQVPQYTMLQTDRQQHDANSVSHQHAAVRSAKKLMDLNASQPHHSIKTHLCSTICRKWIRSTQWWWLGPTLLYRWRVWSMTERGFQNTTWHLKVLRRSTELLLYDSEFWTEKVKKC